MKILRIFVCIFIIFELWIVQADLLAKETSPIVGESEKVYVLADENLDVRGLAFDDSSAEAPRLFVLDHSGKIFVYKYQNNSEKRSDRLEYLHAHKIPATAEGLMIEGPRGLAYAVEQGQSILYILGWNGSEKDFKSQLWRFNVSENTASFIDLSRIDYNIGDREAVGLTTNKEKIYISYDASSYADPKVRVRRGIIQLKWSQAPEKKPIFIKHMPNSGIAPSRGLAFMELDGAGYLWGTVGDDYIYSADAETGRGFFHFDIPKSTEYRKPYWGLSFGNNALWISESVPGPDLVHRVNVTKNLDVSYQGPRQLRHLIMTITSKPEEGVTEPGKVRHYFSRPYSQLQNQGAWLESEKATDVSGAPNATITKFTYDPADDSLSRQYMILVEYSNAPPRSYSSKYEVDIWTNAYRKFVYPHRVNKNAEALARTNYLADDSTLYNLSDKEVYDSFFERVKAYIEEVYGVPADMDNPYWAGRNVLEYIQDHYYYPNRAKGIPATVDYNNNHYDANPGNLKIDLSREDYNKKQIIACSGTSVMLAGAMRYLGIPARWLGTGMEKEPEEWDKNINRLLDEEEIAPCSSGHRISQVWLGNNYGWICFDATPSKPLYNDYDPVPPAQSQWRFMNRAAAGLRNSKRIVFNVGSELFLPLYREFEYDEKLAVDNNCGGDQRYNLQGRYEKATLWKLPDHRIFVKSSCFIKDIIITGPKDNTKITWKLKGDWHRDPDARMSIYLQKMNPDSKEFIEIATLVKSVPYNSEYVYVDFSAYSGKYFRIIIRKDGDSETGGHSDTFNLD